MSPKQLRWTGVACVTLSALIVSAGLLAQMILVLGCLLFFHIVVQVPVGAVGGAVDSAALSVPQVMPAALLAAGLSLALATACFLASKRRGLEGGG